MAKKGTWKRKIRNACEIAGTYADHYDIVIDTLAGIMETRDAAAEQYKRSGGSPVVAYTNKGGHTNLRKNPALVIINECNQIALAYWRDLGLTPAGFKKLDGSAIKKDNGASFEDLLSNLGI